MSYRPARAYAGYRVLLASLWSLQHGSEKACLQRQYLPSGGILFCSLFEGLLSSFPKGWVNAWARRALFFLFSLFPLYCRGGHFWYITSGSSVVFVFPLEHAFRVALFPVEFFCIRVFGVHWTRTDDRVFSPGYRLSLFLFFSFPTGRTFRGESSRKRSQYIM